MFCIPPPLPQARIQAETNDAKNALEAYIYSLRNRLHDSLAPYMREESRAALLEQLEQLEVGVLGQSLHMPYNVGGAGCPCSWFPVLLPKSCQTPAHGRAPSPPHTHAHTRVAATWQRCSASRDCAALLAWGILWGLGGLFGFQPFLTPTPNTPSFAELAV